MYESRKDLVNPRIVEEEKLFILWDRLLPAELSVCRLLRPESTSTRADPAFSFPSTQSLVSSSSYNVLIVLVLHVV